MPMMQIMAILCEGNAKYADNARLDSHAVSRESAMLSMLDVQTTNATCSYNAHNTIWQKKCSLFCTVWYDVQLALCGLILNDQA